MWSAYAPYIGRPKNAIIFFVMECDFCSWLGRDKRARYGIGGSLPACVEASTVAGAAITMAFVIELRLELLRPGRYVGINPVHAQRDRNTCKTLASYWKVEETGESVPIFVGRDLTLGKSASYVQRLVGTGPCGEGPMC